MHPLQPQTLRNTDQVVPVNFFLETRHCCASKKKLFGVYSIYIFSRDRSPYSLTKLVKFCCGKPLLVMGDDRMLVVLKWVMIFCGAGAARATKNHYLKTTTRMFEGDRGCRRIEDIL